MGVPARFLLLAVWCCLLVTAAPDRVFGGIKNNSPGQPMEIATRVPHADTPKVWRAESLSLPFVGEIRIAELSLPTLAVLLGLADGFNPCAMWALVYLLSLLVSLQDRRRIWLLVGSFVFASGVLYFLFMTAWLNVFLLIGFLRPLTIAIGIGALVVGVADLRSFIVTRGAPVCTVGNAGLKQRTMSRMERLVAAPLSVATFMGILALAFVVNSIEFACSAALPAVFTHALSLRAMPSIQYYGYILLYDFFFMLDDLIIFALAAFAMQATIARGYARYGKLVGGVVLVALGLVMLFAPEMLR